MCFSKQCVSVSSGCVFQQGQRTVLHWWLSRLGQHLQGYGGITDTPPVCVWTWLSTVFLCDITVNSLCLGHHYQQFLFVTSLSTVFVTSLSTVFVTSLSTVFFCDITVNSFSLWHHCQHSFSVTSLSTVCVTSLSTVFVTSLSKVFVTPPSVVFVTSLSTVFVTSLSTVFVTELSTVFVTSLSKVFVTELSTVFVTSLSKVFVTSLSTVFVTLLLTIFVISLSNSLYAFRHCQQSLFLHCCRWVFALYTTVSESLFSVLYSDWLTFLSVCLLAWQYKNKKAHVHTTTV